MIGGRARLLFDSYHDFEYRDGSAAAAAFDWWANEAGATADFIAADQPAGPNFSLPSSGGALAFVADGGELFTVGAADFNGKPGATNPAFDSGVTPVQLLGGALPHSFCAVHVWKLASVPAVNLATPWTSGASLWSMTNFRGGCSIGTSGGNILAVAYIYNGTAFVIASAQVIAGTAVPVDGFVLGVTCQNAGSLTVIVDDVDGTPVAAGAGIASDTALCRFGRGEAGAAVANGVWARACWKGNATRPTAAMQSYVSFYL